MRNSLNVGAALKLSRFVRQHEIELCMRMWRRDYPLAALAARRAGGAAGAYASRLVSAYRIHRLTLRRTSCVIAVSQAS